MKVALCCIGRLENRYVVEFVEYYKNLGVDNIFIYDNNYDGEEKFEDVLYKYIKNNFVIIENFRNKPNCQTYAYYDCYNKYHKEYDYMIFVDFDEFIYLVKDKNIKEYLSRNINGYNVIQLNWKIYTDNNLIYDDGKLCLERFIKPMEIYKSVKYNNCPDNYHTKCIIKCEFENIEFENPHIIKFNKNVKVCNNNFISKQNINTQNAFEFNKDGTIDYSLAYIKHFLTKTIEEYIINKMKRGTIEGGVEDMKKRYRNVFFNINERTKEKEAYCKKLNINSNIL